MTLHFLPPGTEGYDAAVATEDAAPREVEAGDSSESKPLRFIGTCRAFLG